MVEDTKKKVQVRRYLSFIFSLQLMFFHYINIFLGFYLQIFNLIFHVFMFVRTKIQDNVHCYLLYFVSKYLNSRPHIIGKFCICYIFCGKEKKGTMFLLPIHFMSMYSISFVFVANSHKIKKLLMFLVIFYL